MEFCFGTLIRWISEQNYGFIREDCSGLDYFVHASGFTEKIAPPQNTRLRFHLAPNPKKIGRQICVDVDVLAPRAVEARSSAPDAGGAR